jgi:hypothetical protein
MNPPLDHTRTIDPDLQTRLLAEYQANITLWQHDDTLRQTRTGNFLGVNTALLAALGVVASLKPQLSFAAGIGFLFALFGISLCVIWYKVQLRSAEYIRFRRFQLVAIEKQLPGLSTFHNIYQAFYNHQTLHFGAPANDFTIAPNAATRSTATESSLPFLIGGFWVAISIAGVVFLLLRH